MVILHELFLTFCLPTCFSIKFLYYFISFLSYFTCSCSYPYNLTIITVYMCFIPLYFWITSITTPLFIEVPVLRQERLCISVLWVLNLPIVSIFYWILELFRQSDRFFLYFFKGCEKTIMMIYCLLLLTAELKFKSWKKMVAVRLP